MQREPWPKRRTEKLRQLVEQGLSTREIGGRLGVSRNAVIGKASRVGLKLARSQGSRRMSKPKPKICLVPTPPVKTSVRSMETVAIEHLRIGHCRWIEGEPSADVQFCGEQVVRGSYCAQHADRAYIKLKKRDRKRPFVIFHRKAV